MVFGYSIATNAAGDVLIAGAPGIATSTTGPPRAFVFRFNGANWTEEWHTVGVGYDQFGYKVAISDIGDVIAVSAPSRIAANNYTSDVGAVDIFRYVTAAWVHEATLIPSNSGDFDYFGTVLTMSGDGSTVAARSMAWLNGTVYVFEHVGGTTWTEKAKLNEVVAHSTGGYGSGLALNYNGTTLAVGSYGDSRMGYMTGAVLMYRKGSAGWAFEHEMLLPQPASTANLGRCVAMNAAGDRVFAGAHVYPIPSTTVVGGVFEYERGPSGWQTKALYTSPNPSGTIATASGFAYSISCSATGRRWVAGEPWSDVHGTDSGIVDLFESPCSTPTIYCTAKTNSLGCVPQIGWQGTPSASSPNGFTISVANTRNQHKGILFYGTNGSNAVPWLGGTLCVHAPLHRTPLQNSAGTPLPTNDCSGTFAFDFNAWTSSGVDASLFAGQHVRAQYYSRDPGSSAQVNVTDAVDFLLEP
jgi:hypothetical protein